MAATDLFFVDRTTVLSGDSINSIAWSAGVFLVSVGSEIYRSVDGVEWENVQATAQSADGNIYVGVDEFFVKRSSTIARSSDGLVWETLSDLDDDTTIFAATDNGYLYGRLPAGNHFRTNDYGVTIENLPYTAGFEYYTHANGVYFKSNGLNLSRSTDGINFTLLSLGRLTFLPIWMPERERFITGQYASSNQKNNFYESADGITWTIVPNTPEVTGESALITNVCYGGGTVLGYTTGFPHPIGRYLEAGEASSYRVVDLENYLDRGDIRFGRAAYNADENYFLVGNLWTGDGVEPLEQSSADVIKMYVGEPPPVGPEEVACFWTDFNKSYEICEGIGGNAGGGAKWWPLAYTGYYFEYDPFANAIVMFNDGEEINTNGVTILNSLTEPPYSIGIGGLGGTPVNDPMSGLTLPDVSVFYPEDAAVTEAWNIAAYFFPSTTGIVLNVGSDAAAATISVERISGPERDLVLTNTDGDFAVFSMFDDDDLNATEFVYTTFEVTVNGQVLTIHCSHYSSGF